DHGAPEPDQPSLQPSVGSPGPPRDRRAGRPSHHGKVHPMTLPAAPARTSFTWPAWGWSLVGVLAVWALIILVRPGSPLDPFTQALSLAPFLVIVALGQMLVITLGPGNIDVSVGTIISMASYI